MSENGGFGAGGLDRLLTSTLEALEQVRASRSTPAQPPAPTRGEAADGKVVAIAGDGGRLTSITVDPRLLREGIDVVCEHIVTAANAALDQLRVTAATAPGVETAPEVDTAALAGKLREVQDSSLRQMEMFSQAIAEAMSQLPGRR
jgi:hypothetical protein